MKAKSSEAGQLCTPFLSIKGKDMAVLGISTNTRLLGLAIIHQGKLLDYSIHLDKSPWSPSKANKIVTSLEPCVRQYCIKKVILSSPYAHHQTKAYQALISLLTKFFQEKNIPVYTESPETFYSLCPEGQKKTKKTAMKALAESFPELTYCYQKEVRNKTRYYIKLFEAVAVAAIRE